MSGRSFVYNLRFPGQYYQAETGLNQNINRDYDSAVGGYVESDPIGLFGKSYSTYGYVGGNPVSSIDESGTVIVPVGTPDQVNAINSALQNLQLVSPTAASLIQRLEDDPTEIFIRTTDKGNSYHPHNSCSVGEVNFNPHLNILGSGSVAWEIRPPEIGLGHELIHAYHDITGTLAGSVAAEENDTVGISGSSPYTENQIRNDYDLPPRTSYVGP